MTPLRPGMLRGVRASVAAVAPLHANLHISARAALPRMRRARPDTPPRTTTGPPTGPATPPAPSTSSAPASVPWFMEEEVVDTPEPIRPAYTAPPVCWVPSYLPATTDIPPAVASLIDLCVRGKLHGLIARPADLRSVDEQQWGAVVRASPLAVIRPMPGSDAVYEGAQDWILVVEVRGESVGAVRHVATEIGAYLKRTRPPVSDPSPELTLDQFLGPPEVVNDAPHTSPPAASRPRGVSRIEHELGVRLPDWQIQKIALSRKFPDGWTPATKLSHEAQHGLRLLHASNPERFSIEVLSRRFRVSPESVRRILKSRWRPSTEAASRQNRRAKLLEAAARGSREQEELAVLRGDIPLEQPPHTDAPEATVDHPVRFEGLVSTADLAVGRARQKSVASRGSGDWCLVDAGWCVVHVVTAAARARYRLEDLWRHNGTETFRSARGA